MNVVSFINQKGGVAKTTTAINVAAFWANLGKKVLLIDLDPQASATKAIFGDTEFDSTIYDVMMEQCEAKDAIVHSVPFDIDVIPSEIHLSGIDLQLASTFGRETVLKRRLANVRSVYDIVVIDCSPSLGLLTVNALMTSKDIVIPICPEYFSMKGIELILETLKNVHVGLGHKVEVRGIIISKYRSRKIVEDVINMVREKYPIPVFRNFIPDSIAVEESHHRHLPMLEYSPKNPAGVAFKNLAKEMWD